jgi:hypothetical protein
MRHPNRFPSAAGWLLPLLTLLVVLGHVCELPAYLDLVASPHHTEGASHSAHDRGHESEMSCDPVDVLASTTFVELSPVLSATQVVPLRGVLPVRLAAETLENSTGSPSRPPLFVLHASLLI